MASQDFSPYHELKTQIYSMKLKMLAHLQSCLVNVEERERERHKSCQCGSQGRIELQGEYQIIRKSSFYRCNSCLKLTVSPAAQILYLEVEMETLTEQLHRPEVCEEDESVRMTGDDLDQIQKHNRELEQQLGDKNRVSCSSVWGSGLSLFTVI